MPYATASSYVGLAKEVTRGTYLAPTVFIPIRNPQLVPDVKMLEDKGIRGSMNEIYNLIPGIRVSMYDFAGDLFPDSIGHLLEGMFGSTDTVVVGAEFRDGVTSAPSGSAITLTSLTAAFSASDVGKAVTAVPGTGTIPGGAVTVTSIGTTDARGYSTTCVITGTSAGTAGTLVSFAINRTATRTHYFTLLNNSAATGNQPPSYSITDFDGFNSRGVPAAQMAELNFKFQADGMVEYTAKYYGNPDAIQSNPTNSVTTIQPEAAWTGQLVVAAAQNLKMQLGELSLKRPLRVVPTLQNSQAPYRLWAGPMTMLGKATFIVEDETELLYYLNNTQPAAEVRFTQATPDVSNGYQVAVGSTQMAFKTGKILRGKEYVEVETDLQAIPNTTDVTAGGLSPVRATVINNQVGAY